MRVWVRAINFGEVLESVFQTHFMEKDELKQLRDLISLSALKFPDGAVGAKLSVCVKPRSSFDCRRTIVVPSSCNLALCSLESANIIPIASGITWQQAPVSVHSACEAVL